MQTSQNRLEFCLEIVFHIFAAASLYRTFLPMPESLPTRKPVQDNPWRPFSGALMAGLIALPLAKLSSLIALSFAEHPFTSDNQTALKISVALRTLVVGLSTLATGIFCLAALGLMALSIQILWQKISSPIAPTDADGE